MAKLVEYDVVTETRREIPGAVRLEGDGWYIEVAPSKDGGGIDIRVSSPQSGPAVILPVCANVVHVATTESREQLVYAEAKKLNDVWIANDEFNRKRGITSG
jgi:hypothetical protein